MCFPGQSGGWGGGRWVSMLLPTGAQGARGTRRQRGLRGATLLSRHGLGRPLVPMAQGRAPLQSGLGPLPLGLALPGTLAQTQRRGRGVANAPLTLTPANERDGAAPPPCPMVQEVKEAGLRLQTMSAHLVPHSGGCITGGQSPTSNLASKGACSPHLARRPLPITAEGPTGTRRPR